MPNYLDDDDDAAPGSANPPTLLSPTVSSPATKSISITGHDGPRRDSFADLVGVMRAKKPYNTLAPPRPRPALSDASNGMQFATRKTSSQSMLSPTATLFIPSQTVVNFLANVEKASTPANPLKQDGQQSNLDARIEALKNELNSFTFDEEESQPDTSRLDTPRPSMIEYAPVSQTPPIDQFSPSFGGPTDPPTPAESVRPPVSAFDRVSEPTVRVSKERWTSTLGELDLAKEKKLKLEQQLADLQIQHRAHLDMAHDVSVQIGKLKYQNEVNRNLQATMGKEIAQRDITIKKNQLDIDSLNKTVARLEDELNRCAKVSGELEYLRSTINDIDKAHAQEIQKLKVERDEAYRANSQAGEQVKRTQNLTDALARREKLLIQLRQEKLEEQIRVTNLEDEIERLQELVNQESLDDFKEKLREKSSQCDRFRSQLKNTEHQLELAQARLKTAANNGTLLHGAAHIVAPNKNSKLPKRVLACTECYAQNLPCDNGARCRNCLENNTKCARWRCSTKHRLMKCDRTPCTPPHDPEGWLVAEQRPEW
ncbi:hypothetical protein ACEQ8H_008985 [Pleosporales sp. CAS-2024a]